MWIRGADRTWRLYCRLTVRALVEVISPCPCCFCRWTLFLQGPQLRAAAIFAPRSTLPSVGSQSCCTSYCTSQAASEMCGTGSCGGSHHRVGGRDRHVSTNTVASRPMRPIGIPFSFPLDPQNNLQGTVRLGRRRQEKECCQKCVSFEELR